MEKVSKYEISPLIAILNMIKVNYFGETEIYKTLLAVLCDYDTRNLINKEKTKHYIQLLLADQQDLAKSLITFLPGEPNADDIPLGQSPITNTTTVNLKRHKKSRHKAKKKSKHKSKQSNIRCRVVLQPPYLATPPKASDSSVADLTTGTPTTVNKYATSEASITPAPTKDSVSPLTSFPEEVCNTQNLSSRCDSEVIHSESIRSKSPIFSNSNAKPVVITTAVNNDSKCYPMPFSMYDSCGFPLKNFRETGQKLSPLVSHRQTSVSAADIGTHMTMPLESISQQIIPETKMSELPSLTSVFLNKPGNSCTLPSAVQPYHSASRMLPLYNLSRNLPRMGDQVTYSTSSHEPHMNSGLEHPSLSNNCVSVSHRTEPTVPVQATLPYKAFTDTCLPHNFIHKPEALLPGQTPKAYNPVQWATRFEHFSAMTVGRTFHNNATGHLQPPPVSQLTCTTGHASQNPPVPHLYTLPKTSAQVPFIPSQVEQHVAQLSHAKSPLHYTMAQTSHSAGKKIFLGTNSNLSAFPYTRQMVLPDGQTQNLYLKRSSINIPDINVTSDIDNAQTSRATGSGNSFLEDPKQGNTNVPQVPLQNVRDVNIGVPRTVSADCSMLQQIGDAKQSLQAPVPFFIADPRMSQLQHPENMDLLGGRGDANILEALPKPRKVTMSANSSVRKKLRLTPKVSKHQANKVLF
ncbi:uncharacterized protein LOC110445668 [Mizuhopecten yessoensis]|uniref:Uncharacterized protein n=1 Tax=Mizuhopecten yessoensis TaxID=6573 RepID=A0A210QZJ5_MIZYE|nr:uncharacterized protein LOC110445668 [Mizuhopecten yessoensis]OWF54085.1 hypothetical protein KP79_PYT15231 [Mizuhopecten yessoensis]